MRTAFSFLLCLVLASGAAVAGDGAALVEEGNRLWAEGNLDGALERYREAGAADPRSVDPRIKAAGALYAKREYRAGVEMFQEAISIEPNNSNAFLGMALGYLHMGADGPAYGALEEAVRLDPSKYDKVRPLMERIEARQTHFTPTPGMTSEDVEEHIETMR